MKVLLFVLGFLAVIPLLPGESPSFQEVRESLETSESVLLDRNGKVLHEMRTREEERRLDWIPLKDVSSHLLEAVVVAEDKRFYQHSGVDWYALGSGLIRFLSSKPIRGASTITMQVVPLIKNELQSTGGRKTFWQKWKQILNARSMETEWTKEEILEAYLNLVSFRGELVGVHSASKGIFGKSPHGLNEKESILLASLIKIPSASPDRVVKRACHLGELLQSKESCDELKYFILAKLSKPYHIEPKFSHAGHLAHRLFTKGETKSIHSTLDRDIQIFASESIRKHLTTLKKKNVKDAAVLVLDNKTGDVLAYVGSSGSLSDSPLIDGVLSKRQAGSTLKPFLYALAIEKKIITPISLLEDSPVEIQVGTGIYSPSNYENHFHGMVQAKIALASSLNVPAVRLLDMVGIDEFNQTLENLGFGNLRDSEHYGLSIALGSLDTTLLDLTNAFRTLANKGEFSQIRYTDEVVPTKSRVFSQGTSFLITKILSDRENRALTFGLENPLAKRFPVAVKTGTSKDMRDNWCLGYTTEVTVGVWVGNFKGDPMWNVSGITGAAPIWSDLISFLHKRYPSSEWKMPEGVVEKEILSKNGKVSQKEFFLEGTDPYFLPEINESEINGILSPVRDSIFAIDPDMPESKQKIFLESRAKDSDLFWKIDGMLLENAEKVRFWKPTPGKHQLELVTREGELVDKLYFRVR